MFPLIRAGAARLDLDKLRLCQTHGAVRQGTSAAGRYRPKVILLGATIRAATLDNITAYRRPRELEHRMVPTRQHGVYQEEIHDPEDRDYRPPPEPERAWIPGGMITR